MENSQERTTAVEEPPSDWRTFFKWFIPGSILFAAIITAGVILTDPFWQMGILSFGPMIFWLFFPAYVADRTLSEKHALLVMFMMSVTILGYVHYLTSVIYP